MNMKTASVFAFVCAATLAKQSTADDFKGVGACPNDTRLAIVSDGAQKGRAFDLVKDSKFRTRYLSVLHSSDHWASKLLGPSEENREYSSPKARALVFHSCEPHNCGFAFLYGALDLKTGELGVRLVENGKSKELGTFNSSMRSGVDCAITLDEAVARRAEERARKSSQ